MGEGKMGEFKNYVETLKEPLKYMSRWQRFVDADATKKIVK
jgi:hypothetical protein